MKIIDVQQVLMQEPRVSWKGAQLIAHADFQNEIIRQRRIEQQRRDASKVSRLSGTSYDPKIKGKKVKQESITENFRKGRRNDHIDVTA